MQEFSDQKDDKRRIELLFLTISLPVCSRTLGSQIHAMVRVVVLLIHHLAQSKVCDLDLPTHVAFRQQNVTYT